MRNDSMIKNILTIIGGIVLLFTIVSITWWLVKSIVKWGIIILIVGGAGYFIANQFKKLG
ncbi:hypothetical protein [Clostridium cellulovorans]|uniref:Uncharacterized protein n=1 Tax=Clostridium cellulovorans (strain ATCC 35296 / DSM 3052 / OCM 3 / 743B) TaxID=573061 RepID=D9SMD8_CLOC7|nr:hypothetical protein [Clostridium cellulovorans]ADL53794.1 hypothetical protein Clocel_4133 [Clostridium cellulovorans 743B]